MKELDDYAEWEKAQIENAPCDQCPKCGHYFDDADFDFQICSKCNYDCETKKYLTS